MTNEELEELVRKQALTIQQLERRLLKVESQLSELENTERTMERVDCPNCQGTGHFNGQCIDCGGEGKVWKQC